jgi:hypothetical protein
MTEARSRKQEVPPLLILATCFLLLRGPSGCGGDGRGEGIGIDGACEELLYGGGGLGAFFDPVFDAGLVHDDLLGGVGVDRVVEAEFLEHLAIARGAVIDGVDAPEGVIFTAEAFESKFNHVCDLYLADAWVPPVQAGNSALYPIGDVHARSQELEARSQKPVARREETAGRRQQGAGGNWRHEGCSQPDMNWCGRRTVEGELLLRR